MKFIRFVKLSLLISIIFNITLLYGQVQSPDKLPAAEAGADLRVYAGDVVLLDGYGSGGTELKAYWDFDDRDGVEKEAEGMIVKHSYKRAGAYIATLTVKDNLGFTSWDKKLIEVLTPVSEGLNITDNFEGGYIGQTYKLGSTYRCHLTKTLHWTVRIDNCENKPVTLRVYGFGKNMPVPLAITHYNDATFSEKFKALYSYGFDSQEWEVLDDAEYKYIPETETMEITAVFKKSPVYVGWSFIYTPYMLHRYLSGLPEKPFLSIENIGKTVQGRDIPMVTIGEPGLKKDKAVWLLGGQHGFEVGGISAAEGMIDFLISDDPIAVEARSKIDFKILPLINPDAHANKWYRFNAHGIDLNRNWDQGDLGHGHDSPVAEPEVDAVMRAISEWMEGDTKRSIAIDIHDWTALAPGVQFSTNSEEAVKNPEIKLFYDDIREKYLPLTILYYSEPMEMIAQDYFHNKVVGNELSMTIEIGLAGGWGHESNPADVPAVPGNVRYIGKQLVKMCLEYFNLSK